MDIYVDISKYINEKGFLAMVPLYTEEVPASIADGTLEPFFIPDKNAFGRARITISQMIDMNVKHIPFKLIKNEELIDIKNALDVFIDELKSYASSGSKKASNYYQMASSFKSVVDNKVRIYLNSNPSERKRVSSNNFANLLKQYSIGDS